MTLTELNDELIIEKQKLNALLEITNAVNKNYKTKNLLFQFETVMKEYIGIPKLAFFNKTKSWKCILSYGISKNCSKFSIQKVSHVKSTTLLSDTELESFEDFEIIMPIYHKEKPLSYILIGGISEKNMTDFIQSHIGFVQTLANVVSVAIENKTLANELINKKLEEKDMEMAAEMQKLLLPSDFPSNQYIDIAGTYLAKNIVSGDYYDFIPINKDEYVFCIGDVSGKGVPAAMLMSNFQAVLRANVKFNHDNITLIDLVKVLNTSVIQSAKGERFISFFVGYYNHSNRILKYINAGHNYPLVINDGNVKELCVGCTALGIFDPLPKIESKTITLKPNTIIVCFTDGLVEAENDSGEQFQSERLANYLKEYSYLNMREMNKALFEEIDKFRNNTAYPDDTALLSIRFI